MAEIVVRAKHEDVPQKTLLMMLRLTFPVWGVVLPIISVMSIAGWVVYFYCLFFPKNPEPIKDITSLIVAFTFTMGFFAIPAVAMYLMRALTKNFLVLEKKGIVFPIASYNIFNRSRFLPWSKIAKIKVQSGGSQSDWKSRSILFFTKTGKTMKLPLSYYKSDEVEQFLVAMETWGSGIEMDPTVSELHSLLRAEQNKSLGHSYTDMWEDELRRRFNPTAFMPLDPGIILHEGKLKVIRQLATGGLSAIYLVQMDDQKLAVLKEAVLPEDAAEKIRVKAFELFAREAELLSKIDHPYIVKVLDHFVEGGRNYMLMEYVPGQDLRQVVKQNGAQKETVVVDWGIQIVNIIKYLHELEPPVIHRDLTPDNLVLRDDGNIVLIDFGAANEFISKGTGTFVGKQSFIAPEQFRGKAVPQSDIYAFGCTLFYLLTGKEPEALECSSPRMLNERVSDELDEVVQSCTQLDAADRFQSAAQLLPVLRKVAATLLGVV